MSPRGQPRPRITSDDVLSTGFLAIEAALALIQRHRTDPDSLKLEWNYALQKDLLKIDAFAQAAATDIFEERLPNYVEIRGEESSLAPPTFEKPLVALLDMLDGTDLLERDLGNWCSAMVIFDRNQIWASLIGMPNGEIYYESDSDQSAHVREAKLPDTPPRIQTVTVDDKSSLMLRDASVAFYGQKPKGLLKTMRHQGMLAALETIADEAEVMKGKPGAPRFRIYTLAGNPMMMKLVEGKIDAVIELSGQRCHDVIPGFAIALKAGAILYDLDTGKRILRDHLHTVLRQPREKFRYVLACSPTLGEEIMQYIHPDPPLSA